MIKIISAKEYNDPLSTEKKGYYAIQGKNVAWGQTRERAVSNLMNSL